MVHTFTPPYPMSTDRVRFTIAVEPEVYEAFADLAASSGVSLSRCIGDWLRDTAEAAQITTVKLNAVRRSPQEAFEAFIRDGVVPGVLDLVGRPDGLRLRRASRGDSPASQAGGLPSAAEPHRPVQGRAAAGKAPPSSNTGGKVGGKTLRTRP